MTGRLMCCGALVLALATARAEAPSLVGSTDGNPVRYRIGETMTFTLAARGGKTVRWERTGDDGRTERGEAGADAPVVVRTSLDRPGFVRLVARLVDGADKEVARFDGGAGAAVGEIRADKPEPDDFDAFWARHRAVLAKVPMDGAKCRELASGRADVKLYEVSVPCAGPRPATGFLSIPAKPGKYPGRVRFHGYNASWLPGARNTPTPGMLPGDCILLLLSAHGYEFNREESYYKALRASCGSNGYDYAFDPVQNSDPEKAYFCGMTYRVMRGLEYLKSRPEWDGKTLVVEGGSQGGLQSIWAAALDHDVTECRPFIPWCCNIAGPTKCGRARGDWHIEWVPALGYYDAANMAKRVPGTCRMVVAWAGLGDYICPPSGVAAFYNGLSCPKRITWVQGATHTYYPPAAQTFSEEGDVPRSVGAGAGFTLYNVFPFSPGREDVAAADAREYLGRTGNDLVLYSLTLHPEGRPAIDKARRYAESFRKFKAALEGSKVRAGILVQAILGHWPRVDKDIEGWTRTIDAKGKAVRFCPLDPGFSQYISDTFTLLARERPAFILTDDDVRAYSHEAECFCDRHMKLFNARRGTSYTADELRARLKAASQSDPDYAAFLAMQREMIEGVVKRARAAVDAVDPSIPGGVCVASEEHLLCAPLARAMAAKGQTPVMRTSTGSYAERMTAAAVPRCVCRMMGFGEYYRGSGIELLCEADTCPHNLWSKSARSFFTHMVNAAFAGGRGAKTWYVNGHKGPFAVSRGYTDVLAENRGFLPALAGAVSGSRWEGLAVPCFTNFPNWHLVTNHREFFVEPGNAGEAICVPFGIPFQMVREFDDDLVYALTTAAEVSRLSDGDLRRILSRRAVVFSGAAEALSKRGLEGLTGVRAERGELVFNREHDDVNGVDISFSPSSGGLLFRADPSAEVLSTLGFRPFAGSERYDVATPATVLFSNALGGRVLTVQYHPGMSYLEQCSEARRAWLLSALDRLSGGLTFAAGHDQDILVLVRRGANGERIVLAENLNPDPVRQLSFRASGAPGKVERLCGDGAWRPVSAAFEGGKVVCDVPVAFYEAVVLRLSGGRGQAL